MREKYESLSLATLKDLAKARGLKGISTLRKPELIERMLQEDEKESTGGEAEMKKTEILQEEPGRQENRVRENRTSYEANERKTYQDKNYQDRNYTDQYFFLFPAQKTSPAHSNNFLHHPAYLCHDTVPFVPHTKKHFYVFLSPAASAPQNLPLLPYHYSEAVHMVLLLLLFPH